MKNGPMLTYCLLLLSAVSGFSQQQPCLHHIIMYGQSLMLGTQSVPLISVSSSTNTLMFKGGIRVGYDSTDQTYYSELVPLLEKEAKSKQTGGALGETPASGCAEEIVALLKMDGRQLGRSVDSNNASFPNAFLLFSSPAQGSTSLKDLTEGIYWQRFERDITEAHRLAKQKGFVYNVPVILWNQGEKDIDIKTSGEEYKAQMKELRLKADQFIKGVTGQKNDVRIIMYQTSSHNVRKASQSPEVANAQYELAKTQQYITMSGPTYYLPYARDAVHLTNVGSKWNGAVHAIAVKNIVFDRQDWRPVFVQRTILKGNNIELQFHVPVPPLLFDTIAVSNPGNFGFRVVDEKGVKLTIASVRIVGNSVFIKTVKRVTRGSHVWYGNNGSSTGPANGARGNLRDSQGDRLKTYIAQEQYRLDNWTPIFKEIL